MGPRVGVPGPGSHLGGPGSPVTPRHFWVPGSGLPSTDVPGPGSHFSGEHLQIHRYNLSEISPGICLTYSFCFNSVIAIFDTASCILW